MPGPPPAPIPANEAERLAALRRYEVLDTGAEEDFDELTRLAARTCGAPMALLSLVDEKRVWYKARVGIASEEAERDAAFCSHAILGRELFVVPDAAADPRFAGLPAVARGVRFYAGAPLVVEGDHAIGTLCVLDRTPRTLSDDQRDALRILARQVVVRLELRRTLRELHRQRDLLRAVVEESADPIYAKDLAGRYVLVNEAFTRLWGRPEETILGQRTSGVFDSKSALDLRAHDERVLASGEPETREHAARIGGEERVFVTTKGVYRDAEGRVAGLVGISHDVTERKRLEERLAWDAAHDGLTGLANRALVLDRLSRLLRRARQRGGAAPAVLYLDLDGFKAVNDGLGHAAGDALLTEMARRLEGCLRPGDIAARLGGDEFLVVLPDAADAATALAVAARICEELGRPVRLAEGEALVGASVGVALRRDEHEGPQDLLRDADAALYRAKAAGKGRAALFGA